MVIKPKRPPDNDYRYCLDRANVLYVVFIGMCSGGALVLMFIKIAFQNGCF